MGVTIDSGENGASSGNGQKRIKLWQEFLVGFVACFIFNILGSILMCALPKNLKTKHTCAVLSRTIRLSLQITYFTNPVINGRIVYSVF